MILAIDPGVRGCGAAVFDGSTLRRAAYVENTFTGKQRDQLWRGMAASVQRWVTLTPYVDRLLLEVPRVYPGSDQQEGDLNDLIDLAGIDGHIAGCFPSAALYLYAPSDWKGQVPKEVMNARARNKLTAAELAVIQSVGAKDHNTLDAIGIGLFHVGRLNRKVIPR